jgi:hypothetical protein
LRPKGHFPRIQTAAVTIRRVLAERITTGFWPAGVVTNRCRHWLAALKRSAVVVLGIGWAKRLDGRLRPAGGHGPCSGSPGDIIRADSCAGATPPKCAGDSNPIRVLWQGKP